MKPLSNMDKAKKWYHSLPEKKVYFELLGAVLTIPVLTTVILLNLNSLRNKDKPSVTPTPEIRIVTGEPSDNDQVREATPLVQKTTAPTPNPVSCKQEVGPADITTPQENETVTSEAVCIDVQHATGEYCAVVWSYSINNSAWSSYDDREICLYNLPPGEKQLRVRVKSIASGDEETLTRKFIYQSVVSPTQQPTPATP